MITTEYTVWCSKCSTWHQECSSGGKSGTIRIFKNLGWKIYDKEWYCPACAQKHKADNSKK